MPILADLTPPEPPPPELVDWGGLAVSWAAWDGTVWDLGTGAQGVALTTGGVRGLTMPPIRRFTSASPALPGTRWTGYRVDEREVFWPVLLWTDAGSQAWLEQDAAWWHTMRPDQVGTWTVTDRLGRSRHLDLRYSDDGDHSFDRDPSMSGWAVYGIRLAAEQPLWRGEPIVRLWQGATAGNDFFAPPGSTDGGGAELVLRISDGAGVETARLTNPGDVDAWVRWTVTGPVGGAQLGAAGGSVSFTADLDAGEHVVIDTRPDRMTATDHTGADVSELVTWDPAPLPPGAEQDLAVVLDLADPGSSVTAELTPLYLRAW